MASPKRMALSIHDSVRLTTVKGEAVQGNVHALDETTSTLVLRLAGRQGGLQKGKGGAMLTQGCECMPPTLQSPSLPPSFPPSLLPSLPPSLPPSSCLYTPPLHRLRTRFLPSLPPSLSPAEQAAASLAAEGGDSLHMVQKLKEETYVSREDYRLKIVPDDDVDKE